MIKINFKDACQACPYRDTYVDEDKLFGYNKVIEVLTTIGCEHEGTCKFIHKDGGTFIFENKEGKNE